MLAYQAFGEFGVAPLERFDDLKMLDNGAGRAIALPDRRAANGAHVQQQVAGGIDDRLRASEADQLGVEGDVGVGILVQVLRGRGVLELVKQMPQLRDLSSGACSVARRAAIDSSAAHIWIISMISRLDLRMM